MAILFTLYISMSWVACSIVVYRNRAILLKQRIVEVNMRTRRRRKNVQEKCIDDDEMQFWMKALAEQTKRGKIQWVCTNYAPISLFYGSKDDDSDASLFQTFEAEANLNGRLVQVEIFEQIELRSGEGDISGSISFIGDEGLVGYNFGTYYDADICSDLGAEGISPQPSVSLSVALTDALVPTIVASKVVASRFLGDKLNGLNDEKEPLLCFPIAKLGKKLLNEKRALDYHRMVLDMDFRKNLLSEL